MPNWICVSPPSVNLTESRLGTVRARIAAIELRVVEDFVERRRETECC